jgi:signal transduction histidine kinase
MLARAERKGLPPDSPFRTEMTEVREIVQTTLEKMRSLSQMLHPAVIDDYGLVKALEWYVGVFSRQSGIETKVEVTGEPFRITGPPAINCFRIVQEALTNASKHSKTKTAEVRLDFALKRLKVEIQDFGVGIVQDKRPRKLGLGLIAMQERAELIGGKLHVERGASGGTVVALEVPLPLPDQVTEEEFAQEAASPQA